MKKVVSILLIALLALTLTACFKPVLQTDSEIIITVSSDNSAKTLSEYLSSLKSDGKIQYETDASGFLTAINGRKPAAANEYWMIYTLKEGYFNNDWGSYEYDGKTYGSATLGITDMPVAANDVFIFVIASF